MALVCRMNAGVADLHQSLAFCWHLCIGTSHHCHVHRLSSLESSQWESGGGGEEWISSSTRELCVFCFQPYTDFVMSWYSFAFGERRRRKCAFNVSHTRLPAGGYWFWRLDISYYSAEHKHIFRWILANMQGGMGDVVKGWKGRKRRSFHSRELSFSALRFLWKVESRKHEYAVGWFITWHFTGRRMPSYGS